MQEQLWDISINIVKDYLSPEVLEKYGPARQHGIPSEQADNSHEQLDRLNGPPSEASHPNKQAEQSDHASQRTDEQAGEITLDQKHDLSQDSKEEKQ